MPRARSALAVTDENRVLRRLGIRTERRGRRGIADGIVPRRIVVGGEQQIIDAALLDRAGALVPDHAAAQQFPGRCRRGKQHRLADRAAEVGGKFDPIGLTDALIPPIILAVVAGIKQVNAPVVVKQQTGVNDAVARRKQRVIVYIDKGTCRIVRLRKPDAVTQLIHSSALRRLKRCRIHHVISAAVCVDLGRPIAGRAEGLFGHPIGVAERRPGVEIRGRPAGIMSSAGAVHVILLFGFVVKDKRVADVRDLSVRTGKAVRIVGCGGRNSDQFLHKNSP